MLARAKRRACFAVAFVRLRLASSGARTADTAAKRAGLMPASFSASAIASARPSLGIATLRAVAMAISTLERGSNSGFSNNVSRTWCQAATSMSPASAAIAAASARLAAGRPGRATMAAARSGRVGERAVSDGARPALDEMASAMPLSYFACGGLGRSPDAAKTAEVSQLSLTPWLLAISMASSAPAVLSRSAAQTARNLAQ